MSAAAAARVGVALRHAAVRTGLLQTGKRLVVAYSGGQDSTTLLHALAARSAKDRPWLMAVYVDHGLRVESAQEAERVTALARAMGVEAASCRVDVGAYRARLKRWSVQQAARAARYQALAAVVQEVSADALLVAHTADDQAETLLLHLVRGAGLAGLTGMRLDGVLTVADLGPALPGCDAPPSVRIVRPLLRVERATTAAYCAEMALAVVDDPSNQTRRYTRNRVRLDVLPRLAEINPAVRQVLARTADLVAEDQVALDAYVETTYASLARSDGSCVAFERSAWRALPRGAQRRLLRRALAELLGNLRDVPQAPVEDALDLMERGTHGGTYDLPRGVTLAIEGDVVQVSRAPDEMK